METLLPNFKININSNLYLKDPESSDLGRKIISNSIILIEKLGIEDFTFKKLASKIHSNESSVYRYFENKHKLLLYLSTLYWGIIEYQMVFHTTAIKNDEQKLMSAIEIVISNPRNFHTNFNIDEQKLKKIINSEFIKVYHNKSVDEENKAGYFASYKRLISRISKMIETVNPDYKYSQSLASLIVEGSLSHYFLSEHFENLTDCHSTKHIQLFYQDLLTKTLNI
ncbi:MAG: TetR family transcriptional regulator [Psychroflexus sp.]